MSRNKKSLIKVLNFKLEYSLILYSLHIISIENLLTKHNIVKFNIINNKKRKNLFKFLF